jgi:hypothetical protein
MSWNTASVFDLTPPENMAAAERRFSSMQDGLERASYSSRRRLRVWPDSSFESVD